MANARELWVEELSDHSEGEQISSTEEDATSASKAPRWRVYSLAAFLATAAVASVYCLVIEPVIAGKVSAAADFSVLDASIGERMSHVAHGSENIRAMLEDRAGRNVKEVTADAAPAGPEGDVESHVQQFAYKVVMKAVERHMEKYGHLYRQAANAQHAGSAEAPESKQRELIGAAAARAGAADIAGLAGDVADELPGHMAFYDPDMSRAQEQEDSLPALFPPSKEDIDKLLKKEINKVLAEQIAQQNAEGIDAGPQPDPNAQTDGSASKKGSTWIDSVTGYESAHIDTFQTYEVDSNLPDGSLVAYLIVKTHLNEPVKINGKAYLTKDRTGGFYPFQIRLNNLHTWAPGIKFNMKMHTGWPLVLVATKVPWVNADFWLDATCFSKGEEPPTSEFKLCTTIMKKELEKQKPQTRAQIGTTATQNMRMQFEQQINENLPWR
eukprot:TRINITY_DN17885_c0_g2_i1.p1 TRINITY_DN17885_c0_g2~~TRINITY_DN17885_c0_g2_i1.p1  ORF type:complete len:440 (+),score=95.25 TRINITY_DN17885_c0_g2_i1:91-1410(+)